MSNLKITKWQTLDPLSPGWLSLHGLLGVLDNPSSIPPQFFNMNIMYEYVEILAEIQSQAHQHVGFENYGISAQDGGVRYTVLAFDTLQNLTAYEDSRSQAPIWPLYEEARTRLENLLSVAMTIYPKTEKDITGVDFNALTNAEVEAWLAN